MKQLAVIILNWNGLELLKRFIPDAAEFSISDESDLFVADNGSTDGSLHFLRQNFPQVKILELGQNYGFAEGYNRAIEATRYPFTVLLNSDVRVTKGWWRPLLDFMQANPKAGACQPKILSERNPGMFEYAGAAGGYLDHLGYPFCRGRIFDNIEADNGQYDDTDIPFQATKVTWASGAALMVRTPLYLELGGLDPDFFAHMEEIDLCCRMANAGYGVYAIGSAAIYHVGGATLSKENPKKTYLNFRNNLLLLHKNLPRKRGKKILLLRRLADTLAFGMFILKGDFKNARAVVKAHNDFRKMKKNYKDFPKTDTLRHLPGSGRYIVWEHYLLNKLKK